MKQYMIPLLLISVLSMVHASNTEIKNQFTVTHIMLELFQNQEEDDRFVTISPKDSNETIYLGGKQR